ncbi:hypothetical protein ABIB06_007376 [Bradyrhizobium sp. LB8.2]|jgi:hypothetical protein|uniref:ABC-three component system middle component 6 n=1 Tax=unclassified Bradyrhizobium TaxID=2631580 RepID=UPI001FFBD2AB|nr:MULTISPECIES: ABC-three component system middle component 6 [unclassified Bradyrhizobium]MCK1338285.1 hypothetical protein [Bradyrhizobium sp. 38]MCK1777693.1 hypothetical protein [Bradyrhizobium sp. 132]
MILPTKHISENETILGVGATILQHLDSPITVSGLWERTKVEKNVGTFERFVLAADLLFIIGAIELRDGLFVRVQS